MTGPTWTIVWGWTASGASVWRESFTDKRRCWGRVRAIMNALEGGVEDKRTPVLQVWTEGEVTTFRLYDEGSRFCRWGRWGSFTMKAADRGVG